MPIISGKYLNENMNAGWMLAGIRDRKRIFHSCIPIDRSVRTKGADFALITPALTIRAGLTHMMDVMTRYAFKRFFSIRLITAAMIRRKGREKSMAAIQLNTLSMRVP